MRQVSKLMFWALVMFLASLLMVAYTGVLPEPIDSTPTVATDYPTVVWTPEPVVERGCNRISYNINAQAIPNADYLKSHLTKLDPCYVVVMDGFGLALEIADTTGATVIHRDWSRNEGSEWQHISPDELVTRWQNQGSPHILRYSTNEPSIHDGNISDFLAYEEELMRIARSYGYTISVGNFGVGRYQPHWVDNGLFDNWLRSVVEYSHVIGAHEYTVGLLPFGVGQMPSSALLDRTRVQPSVWSTSAQLPTERLSWEAQAQGELPFGLEQYLELNYLQAQTVEYILPPYWHLRRADWFLIRADELGISRPTIVLTEAFWDNMNDVSEVQQMREIWGIDRYTNDMRGINSLEALWAYYYPTWSPAEAACEQLLWADNVYPEDYAGFAMFTWSSNPHWVAFDFSGNQNGWNYELHQMLERQEC